MSIIPIPMSNVAQSLASLRLVNIPKKFWGFESFSVTIELANLGMEELNTAEPGRDIVVNLDLIDSQGNHFLNILSEKVPAPVAVGTQRQFVFSPYLRVFEGHFRMQASLLQRKPGEPIPTRVRTPLEFIDIEIEPAIHEALLELTNICNFRCSFCPQGELRRPPKMMDFELVRKCLKDLAAMGHHHPIRLHLLGEPTLYKRFEDVVNAAHDEGLTLVLATNGSRLNEKNIEMIFRSRLDEILISLNTPEQQDYDSQRGSKMSFNDYVGGICNFVAERAARGGPPKTRVNLLYDLQKKDHPEERERIQRIVASWAAMIEEKTGKHASKLDILPELIPGQEVAIEILEGLQFQWTAYHKWGLGTKHVTSFCRLPWFQLAVLADGTVTACCVDTEGEIDLGNVVTQSIAEIWRGPKIARMRQRFLNGLVSNARCGRCDVQHNKNDFFPVS